jgi:hypothetical protein
MAACNLPHAIQYPAYCQIRSQLVAFFAHVIHSIFPRHFYLTNIKHKNLTHHKNYLFMQTLSLGVTTSVIFWAQKGAFLFD